MARKKIVATIKTVAMAEKKIATLVKIAATTRTTAAMRIMAVMVRALKVFSERSIITVEEKITIVAAKTSRRDSDTNFHAKEKYIWINGDFAAFV